METPLVAVFMVTYNHENFIRQAIESVLMQKTTFPIKLFIGEDCSTDQTLAICTRYKEENPEKIEVRFNKQNIGATNNAKQIYEACFSSGAKYIAMLEGDDYWTDTYKLQKQVDFLEKELDYSICFHPVKILKDQEIIDDYITREVPDTTSIMDLADGNYIHTPSVVFRNKLFDQFPTLFFKAPVGDYFLHMLNAKYGKIKKMNECMAIYRLHPNGAFSSISHNIRIQKWLTLIYLMIPSFNGNVRNKLLENFYLQVRTILLYDSEVSIEFKMKIWQYILEIDPDFFERLIIENENLKKQLLSGRKLLRLLLSKIKKRLRIAVYRFTLMLLIK
jgi:glycosyltransferase involved in cell wall biosynthesis